MTPRLLDNSVRYAQRTAAALMIGLTLLCFAQSYRQLIDFATEHGQPRPWNWAWPGMLDGFTLLGELLLFAAVVKRWNRGILGLGAALAAAGFGASLAANVGYLPRADAVSRIASAAAPTGAAVALCAALIMLEFQVRDAMHAAAEAERSAKEERSAALAAQRAAAELQRAEAQRATAEAQRAAAEAAALQQRRTLHVVPRSGAAPRDAGPEAAAARSAVRAALARGEGPPSQRELGRVEYGGQPIGVRLAKRVLEEFGDVVVDHPQPVEA